MKLERAQELYSDYAEGALTPALRQALEQHFDADPAARADYGQFSAIYSLLEQPAGEEMDVPLGFRAKILERVTAQPARQEAASSRPAWLGWFMPPAHRRATGGALAALAAVVVGAVIVMHPGKPNVGTSDVLPTFTAAPVIGLVQSVDVQPGTSTHQFHLHLPSDVSSATVNAYVITATEQITDPAHLADATPAVSGQHLTNHQGLQIPISPVAAPPAGSTLTLLAEYTPDAAGQTVSSEAVFTPFGAPDPATAAPVNASFLDGMQAVAAHYGATVIVDVSSAPIQAVTADFSGPDPAAALKKHGRRRRRYGAEDRRQHLLCRARLVAEGIWNRHFQCRFLFPETFPHKSAPSTVEALPMRVSAAHFFSALSAALFSPRLLRGFLPGGRAAGAGHLCRQRDARPVCAALEQRGSRHRARVGQRADAASRH